VGTERGVWKNLFPALAGKIDGHADDRLHAHRSASLDGEVMASLPLLSVALMTLDLN
jgi:hypothetical protein